MFIIGDRVKVTGDCRDGGNVLGMMGTVTVLGDNNRTYGIVFDESRDFLHDLNGECENGYGYWLDKDELTLKDRDKKIPTRKCTCCGQVIPKSMIVVASNKKNVCKSCVRTKGYSTQNNVRVRKASKHNKTYGFELECIPNSYEDKASILSYGFNMIPTSDCSLASGGVEFKTPTYQSLRGVKETLRTFASHASLTDRSCGQHINIGDTKYIDEYSMDKIRRYATDIFDPLYYYLKDNESDTKRVIGRFFTSYADRECYTSHCSWVNLGHNNRIEFRLSKYRNANQYFQLICMWSEMLDAIIVHYLNKYSDSRSRNRMNAEKTSKRLIQIFNKYKDGKATCQRPERNSYTNSGTKRAVAVA